MTQRKTLIIGLGNTMLSDDGVGIYVAREIRRRCKESSSVDVVEACLGGIGLLDVMAGYEKVIIIDAIITGQHAAGQIYKLTVDDLGDASYPVGPHFLDVRTAVELGRMLGYTMPSAIDIHAIEIKDNTTFSETLHPEVEKAVPVLAAEILKGFDGGLFTYECSTKFC